MDRNTTRRPFTLPATRGNREKWYNRGRETSAHSRDRVSSTDRSVLYTKGKHMGEQRTGIPLADGLSCTLDATKEHPERYATIIGGAAPLPLNKVQALALFRIMLSHLAQLAGDDLHNDTLLQQVDLIQLLTFSMELLDDWSDTDLEDRQTLRDALEQYDFAYDFHETLMHAMGAWEEALRFHYDRIESAASKIDVDLEDLLEEEEDEREDETTE